LKGTTKTNLFQKVNKLPEKVQVNVRQENMKKMGIVLSVSAISILDLVQKYEKD